MIQSLHNIFCGNKHDLLLHKPAILSPFLCLDLSQGQGLQTVCLTGCWCWKVGRVVACSVLESVLLNGFLTGCDTMFLHADGSPCLQTELCEFGSCVLEEFWTLTGSLMLVDMQGWVRRWHSVASSPQASPSSDRKRAAFWRHEEKPSINWRFSPPSVSFAFLAWATEFCRNRTVYSRISAFSILLWEGLCKNERGEFRPSIYNLDNKLRGSIMLRRWTSMVFLHCAQGLAEEDFSGSPDSDSSFLFFVFLPEASTAAESIKTNVRSGFTSTKYTCWSTVLEFEIYAK